MIYCGEMYFHRRSIRLDGYDYSGQGCYFVTADVQDKLPLFWSEGGVNNVCLMIDYWWREIPNHFRNIFIDEYVIMPDHVHGIIQIKNVGADRCVRPNGNNDSPKLGDIMQWFKTMTTNEYIKGVKSNNWPRFRRRLWQRNYYEEIIRNEIELNRIREYIKNNPRKLVI